MIGSFLAGVFTAFILSFFGVDHYFIQMIDDLFHTQTPMATYYVVFGILGILIHR